MKKDEKIQEETKKTDKVRLDAIAAKYGVKQVFEIIVPIGDEGETISAFFKKPDRNIIGLTMTMEKRNPLRAKEVMLTSCFLEGNKQILEDDDCFMSALTVVDNFLSIKQAELKKN